jgi:hypothetical protein
VKKSPFHPHPSPSPPEREENSSYISIYFPSPLVGEGRVRGILDNFFDTFPCQGGLGELEYIFLSDFYLAEGEEDVSYRDGKLLILARVANLGMGEQEEMSAHVAKRETPPTGSGRTT